MDRLLTWPAVLETLLEGEDLAIRQAEYIANQLPGVTWWIRNVERKPTSFSLQTASDRFYPDFLIGLDGWSIMRY
mgnify:CR=1 FL=1